MDSDLQDDPVYIPDLYRKALEGIRHRLRAQTVRRFGF